MGKGVQVVPFCVAADSRRKTIPQSDLTKRYSVAKNPSNTVMTQRPSKQKKAQPPPVDKLIKPAIVVGLAILAYQFIKGLNSDIPRIDVNDELELREVFFGEGGSGKSYAVLCHDDTSNLPISSVFQEAYQDGSSPAEFRIVDCNYVLPSSGKSIAERFKLNMKNRPTIFLSGTVGAPQQIPLKHLKTGSMLVKLLRGKLELRAAKIETTQDLRSKCLDKDVCGLLLKGSKQAPKALKDAMGKLLKEYPNVSFASIDSTVLYVLNLEEHLPELYGGQARFVVFKKVSGSLEVGGKRLITSIAPLKNNGATYLQMSNLVAGVVTGKETPMKISSLPVVKTRTKKLEEQERAKRERRTDQKQRQEQGKKSDETPGGAFTANDGSREGRRAERERRRAEHRATHNVREKTPEEIAEMERKRRQRMEEEAAKWNMAPDDLPEEGDPVNEDDYEEILMEEGEYITEEVEDGDEEDDEDVIDLD